MSRGRFKLALLGAGALSCWWAAVLSLSEGPQPGGGIGWSLGQEVTVRILAVLGFALVIAAIVLKRNP